MLSVCKYFKYRFMHVILMFDVLYCNLTLFYYCIYWPFYISYPHSDNTVNICWLFYTWVNEGIFSNSIWINSEFPIKAIFATCNADWSHFIGYMWNMFKQGTGQETSECRGTGTITFYHGLMLKSSVLITCSLHCSALLRAVTQVTPPSAQVFRRTKRGNFLVSRSGSERETEARELHLRKRSAFGSLSFFFFTVLLFPWGAQRILWE